MRVRPPGLYSDPYHLWTPSRRCACLLSVDRLTKQDVPVPVSLPVSLLAVHACLSAYLNTQRLHGYDGHIRWGRAVNHRPDLVSRDGIAGSPSSAASAPDLRR